MRIAHIAAEIVPTTSGSFVGGLAKNVSTLAKEQINQGHDVEIFTSDINHRLREGITETSWQSNIIPTVGRYASLSYIQSYFLNAVREVIHAHKIRHFDIIHLHSAYAIFGAIGYYLGHIDTPKIFSLYSPNFSLLSGHSCKTSNNQVKTIITRFSTRPFNCIIVLSRNLETILNQYVSSRTPVRYVPPIIDSIIANSILPKNVARSKLNLDMNSILILYIGNFSSWKGIDILLQSIKKLKKEIQNICLLAAWGEPYQWSGNQKRIILKTIKDLDLENNVQHIGIVKDIGTVISASDIVVEPFRCTCKVLDSPLSILEAMARGKPVISSSVGGIPELLGKDQRGIVVSPGDIDQLTEAIRRLVYDEKTRERLGDAARNWILQNMDKDRILSLIQFIYESANQR